MTYGYVTVKCPRCNSTIEIISGGATADIFTCPVCLEGEIRNTPRQRELQPVPVHSQNRQRLEQYITTLSNIWPN
jgi:predicted RNA-binding Zn-ribbon protein involved in translation (DUF1610 family)